MLVDNGSQDETGSVIAAFKGRLPLQPVTEPEMGKNAALNTGLAFVEGDLAVFTDDDVFPHRDWLVELRKAADEHPGYSILGGLILPRWEAPPPIWIQWVKLATAFALTPPFVVEGELPDDRIDFVFGPNMAVRAGIFDSGIRFDPSIGPRGTSYPMGSETEFLLRLRSKGNKAWHVHSAVVEHFIRKEQLDEKWLLERAVRSGRGSERLFSSSKLFGVPRHVYSDLPLQLLRITLADLTRRREMSFRARWRFNSLIGAAQEARIMTRQRHARGTNA